MCVCERERDRETERQRKRERAIARKYREMNDAPKMLRCEAYQQVVWLPLGSLTQGRATAATGARNTHTHTHTANSRTQHTHTATAATAAARVKKPAFIHAVAVTVVGSPMYDKPRIFSSS